MTPRSRRPCAGRGLTLIELMVVLAITAVLMTLAVPSFGAQVSRQRLKSAAEALAADLAEARFEAARRGSALHVQFAQGPAWCWSVATTSGCDCHVPQQRCQVKAVQSAEHPGVSLAQSSNALFDPANGSSVGNGTALLRSARGDELQVGLTRLGRVRVCAPQSAALGYPRC
jgi:type IV fimbrial biogenesis protein FimT